MANPPFKFVGCLSWHSKVRISETLSSFFDLACILDFYVGLHGKASAHHEIEAGIRSREGCEEVHRGALTVHQMYLSHT